MCFECATLCNHLQDCKLNHLKYHLYLLSLVGRLTDIISLEIRVIVLVNPINQIQVIALSAVHS